ncbi:Transposase [Oopsacas minuta]|uniref:Transposase n=1 Tax=Oopsacas minuta TaxID=111878 RepID=A0AAV7JEJ2_9METZ|nr:Transposase [Oopsacas minuta]
MLAFNGKCTHNSEGGFRTEEGPSAMGTTLLNFPQKAARLQMAEENLEIYEGSDPRRKQDGRVWLKKGEVTPAVCISDFRAPKVLYWIFFDGLGPVTQIPVPKGQTLTGQFYADVVLPEVEKHYLKRRPKTGTRGLKILHDNARPHKSLAVRQKIKDMDMHEVPHPPYSPDIAPCDFWLFRKLKDNLSGREFEDRLSLGRAIYRYLEVIPKDEYRKTFENWIKRLNSVVAYKADYFEHS